MQITGWGKTKTGEVCANIRFLYAYPPSRKDILVKDFCNYLELNESDVQEAVSIINTSDSSNILPKQTGNTVPS
ncbi:MAG TPA: hypothetical protein DCM71_10030 [Runella sp.]|nr:hypothetical protein [Runella sp.]